jgi:ectoine hydroxylase-related dioxygenase (phytanoyl-CoA dioxygenase family)
MPVDYVPEDTCVQYAKGSHLGDKWYKPKEFGISINFNPNTNYTKERTFLETPDKDEVYRNFEILKYSLNPGDCIVFHMRTLHGAPGNLQQNNSRRVLSTRWFGRFNT